MRAALPSGLVTFLLTDIEGSTRMFARLGGRWPIILDAHNRLLREVWAAHDGVEFKSEGDAQLVAFESAASAFRAAVEAQARLRAAAWPPDVSVRVRMGLHSGIAYARDGDYVALALHQAARIVGTGNGGQVVASGAAVTEAGTVPGVRDERLGAYRLRDFDEPVELFQVVADDREQLQFAPLRAIPADGHNLEQPGDVIVGRDDELAAVATLVAPGRVVTLCGPGGVGKTRLAVEFGLSIADRWPHGVWMVDLFAVPPGRPVATAVGDALGVAAAEDPDDAVVAHLRAHEALVILDNCEHVLPGVRELVRRIAASCPTSGVLATSRERLGVRAEQVYVVQPLHADGAGVELFVDRARRRDAGVVFDAVDRRTIAELCVHLDGLPLAIELAAARSTVLSPRAMLERVVRGWAPDGGHEVLSERQQTLQRLLDWSYDLLAPVEQTVFRALGVFVGSFDLGAVQAAVGDPDLDELAIAEIVWRLVDKSLVQNDRRDGESRYRLLQTVRTVAAGYASATGASGAVRARLARHYVETFPFERRGNRDWLARMALERATVRQLADDLLADGEAGLGCALARLGVEVLFTGGSPREALRELLAFVGRVPDVNGLARLYATIAKEHAAGNDLAVARADLTTARRLVEQFGTDDVLGPVILSSAELTLVLRDGSTEDLLALHHDLAHAAATQPVEGPRADLLADLAMVGSALEDPSARATLEEVAATAERLEDHVLRMFALNNLAEAELRDGEIEAAALHQLEAVRLSAELGVPAITAFGLILAARIAQPQGLDDTAVRLHGAADALLEDCGYEMYPDDRRFSDAMLAAARNVVGERFDTAYRVGRALTTIEAVELAEAVLRPDHLRRASGPPRRDQSDATSHLPEGHRSRA